MPHPGVLLRVMRIGNVGMIALSILLGGVLGTGMEAFDLPALWWAALSLALVGAGGNVANDLLDVDIDRINRPDRPIPSGALSVHAGWILALGLTAGGVAAGFFVSPWHGLSAVGCAALLAVYSASLKYQPVTGNLVVAGLLGFTVLFGAAAVGNFAAAWPAAAFAAGVNLAREMLKDVEDLEGDRALGARTLPARMGKEATLSVVRILLILCVAALPLPYLLGAYPSLFLLVALIPAFLLLACLPHLVVVPSHLSRASRWLKWSMAGGVLAFFLGRPV